jgi:hypothetical protein
MGFFSNLRRLPRRSLLFFIATPLWLELVFRGATQGGMFCETWTFLLPLSASIGLLLALLLAWLPARGAHALSAAAALLLGVLYAAAAVYVDIFGVMPSLYSITGAGHAMQFWREVLSSVWRMLPWIALDLMPFGAIVLSPSAGAHVSRRGWFVLLALFVLVRGAALGLILSDDDDIYSPRALYTDTYLPMRTTRLFGAATALELDARRLITGEEAALPEEDYVLPTAEEASEESIYEPNTMDFDFEALAEEEQDEKIAALHRYFAAQTPTLQNEYTGMFEGKNLVLITAEGWSPYAVSEELTPTLYKMLHEGFVFERYYNPIWGASTTDGEYAACIGLVPKAGVWSFQESSSNYLPLCMGRQFSSLGYTTVAYHDHYFDYYRRDLSHPNMGYTYKGLGSGLNVTETWPESDLEMMKLSIDEYIGETPFLAYYMTVSGHLNYTFFGNAMSTLHRDVVEDLDLSDNAKAYLACNYELELALTELLSRLEEAGIADDTVICIAPDHYPYGLSTEEQNELAGHEVDETFELYESCLVLYSPSMEEPVVVTKPCSSLDIVPTLSNLFGLTYDSRLLVGQDVLSTASPLVLFNSRNWITDLGSYDVASRTFTPADGVTDIPDDYVAAINRKVNGKFTVSAQILETDYYRVLWEEAGLLSE